MNARTRKPKLFATEADLCAAFIAHHEQHGFVAYAETCGFDILLVRQADGVQFGVQAKLKLNAKVLDQLLPDEYQQTGPDHRVILVPDSGGIERICEALGFILQIPYGRHHAFPKLCSRWREAPYDWNPVKRCKLPDYVPDVVAGDSGPVQLTPWKVSALRVIAHIETRGEITRKQIKEIGCDPTRWCQHWLIPHSDRSGVYVIGPKTPRFDQQHPRVYAEIVGKARAA